MFQSVVHLLVAAVLGILTMGLWRTWSRFRRTYTLIALAVAAGLVYDNAILGLGRWIGEGDLLEGLSWPRFVLHALTTPLLLITGFGAMRDTGLRRTDDARAHAAVCGVATLLVAWGVAIHLVGIELVAESSAGVVSYGAASPPPPVPAIATIVGLLAAGAALWWSAGWIWLALGAAVMAFASGLGGVSPLLTNVGELALVASLAATEHETGQRTIHWVVTARHPSRPRWPEPDTSADPSAAY